MRGRKFAHVAGENEMSVRKRLGYNWKARQQKDSQERRGKGESLKESGTPIVDTNQQILPPKRAKLGDEETCSTSKRKKLSSKQRKRLLKVIEVKEKKAKASTLIKAHHTC